MSLYIPKMSDTPAITIPGLASNFQALDGSQIVEWGSNENGEYIRWENGLQLCRRYVSLVELTPALAPNQFARVLDYSYPAAFVDTPYADCVGTLYSSQGVYLNGIISLRSSVTDMWAINGLNLSTSEATRVRFLRLIAIGRWK